MDGRHKSLQVNRLRRHSCMSCLKGTKLLGDRTANLSTIRNVDDFCGSERITCNWSPMLFSAFPGSLAGSDKG